MGFGERTADANTLIEVLERQVFGNDPCSGRLALSSFGYETHVPSDIRDLIRYVSNPTSRHIRFAPDFFVVDQENKNNVYLLEIKATLMPLYSEARIGAISAAAGNQTLGWTNIGQMEALAYDNYLAMSDLGVRTAVLNYCAYYDEYPLICDFIERYQVVHRDIPRGENIQGTGTPYVNFDARSVRGLGAFLCSEHFLNESAVLHVVDAAQKELKERLPLRHHENSPLYHK